MSLSLRQIRYISEVAREGSIQAASQSLRISQSSIMAAIDNAEEVVGARLFERRPARGIQVTPAGRTFLATARTMLAAESEFIRSIDQIARTAPRTIRIGCFEPFGPLFMPEILRRVVADHGETSVSLMEGNQPQLRAWLNEGSVDAIVTYDIGYGFGDSVTPICKAPPHVLLHASDSLAAQERVSIVDIAERPLVLLDLPETATYLLALFDIFAARPRISFHTRSYESVRAAVSVGFGAAILNLRPLMPSMQDSGALVRRPIVEQLPAPTLVVADIYGASKPWIVRRLIEVMRGFFDEAGYPALDD